jgi:hypothetical protein
LLLSLFPLQLLLPLALALRREANDDRTGAPAPRAASAGPSHRPSSAAASIAARVGVECAWYVSQSIEPRLIEISNQSKSTNKRVRRRASSCVVVAF